MMKIPKLTHEEEVKLERFVNLMVELIERHADAVDKDEMMEKIKNQWEKLSFLCASKL